MALNEESTTYGWALWHPLQTDTVSVLSVYITNIDSYLFMLIDTETETDHQTETTQDQSQSTGQYQSSISPIETA